MKKTINGFTAVGALVGILITSIGMVTLSQMFNHLNRSSRGLASNNDLMSIANLESLLLDAKACEKTGLVGIDISPLLGPSPIPVSVSLKLPGTNTPVLQSGMVSGTRVISSLKLSELNAIGAPGSNTYFATLVTDTAISGSGHSIKDPKLKTYLHLTTDGGGASQKIVSCYNSTSPSDMVPNTAPVPTQTPIVIPSPSPIQCPPGQRLQGIKADGTGDCKSAFNFMGGYFMVTSSRYPSGIIDNPNGLASTTYTYAGTTSGGSSTTQTLYFGNCGANTYTGKCSCPDGYGPIVLFQQSFECDSTDPFKKNYCSYHYPSSNPLGNWHWTDNWLVNAISVLCVNGESN